MKAKHTKNNVVTTPHSKIVWVSDNFSIQKMLETIQTLKGPIAVDSERASGIKYDGDKAYLIQIKRENTIFLIDPTNIQNLDSLNKIIQNEEWILHAADQDIPCLAKQGLFPKKIFDTEKSSRLLNYPKVSLGKMIEEKLGITLEKLHSQENWATRPIPNKWLNYAALDVEYLIELRNVLYQELEETNKLEYAFEEFDYCVKTTYPNFLEKNKDKRSNQYIFSYIPGCSTLKSPRQLAIVKELYLSRDSLGKKLDIAPTMLLPNKALTQAAKFMPSSREEMAKLPLFKGKKNRTHKNRWWGAIARAYSCPENKLPIYTPKEHKDSYPNTAWNNNYPEMYNRLQIIKTLSEEVANKINIRIENLITSKARHIIAWNLNNNPTLEEIDKVFALCSLRKWQCNVLREPIFEALKSHN